MSNLVEVPGYFGSPFYFHLVHLFHNCFVEHRNRIKKILSLNNNKPTTIAAGIGRLVYMCADCRSAGDAIMVADSIPRHGAPVAAEVFGKALGWYSSDAVAVTQSQLGCTDWACRFVGALSQHGATDFQTVTVDEMNETNRRAELAAIHRP